MLRISLLGGATKRETGLAGYGSTPPLSLCPGAFYRKRGLFGPITVRLWVRSLFGRDYGGVWGVASAPALFFLGYVRIVSDTCTQKVQFRRLGQLEEFRAELGKKEGELYSKPSNI
jgi:hypothetical protein